MASSLSTIRPAGQSSRESSATRVVRAAAVLLVISLIVGIALFSFPARRNDAGNVVDFSFYYSAAQMVRQGLGGRLYDLKTQVEFQSRVGVVHAFYNHPPYETLIFTPLTYLGYRTAYTVWTLASLGLMVIAASLIDSHTKIKLAISQYVRLPADFGLVVVLFITCAPATTCFLLGQDSMLTLLIYTLVFVLLQQNSETSAGCVLALGLYKFPLILPLAVIFLLRGKWKFMQGFSIVGFLLGLISIVISGPRVLIDYPRLLFFDSTYQKVAGFNPRDMPNIRGFLYLMLDGKLGKTSLTLLVATLSISVLWIAARYWKDEELSLSFSIGLIATLLASYHLYNYDLVLLLLPIAILVGGLAAQGHLLRANALNVTLVAFFTPPLHRVLLLHSVYALMSLPIAFLLLKSITLTQEAGAVPHLEMSKSPAQA
jgi:hypothetical protein